MAQLTIQVDSPAPRAALERLIEAVGAPVVLNLLAARMVEYTDESFRTAGRRKWRRLAWGTLALRERGGDKPLQDTGRYKQSFVQESDGQTFVEVGTNLRLSSGLSLGKIHEHGTGPYTIRVRRARVLIAPLGSGIGGAGEHGPVGMIGSKRMSHWLFFGKEVHHPGIPARPVLPETVTEAENILRPVIEGALERAVKE